MPYKFNPFTGDFDEVRKLKAQVVTVAKSGGEYTTIQGAIDSISDNSTSKRYIILIYPGTYTENVVMEEYVSLVGLDHESTEITSTSGTTVIAPSNTSDCGIYNLKLSSTPTANGAVVLSMSDGELDIYNTYLKMTSSTNGVNGSLLVLSGGEIEFNHCFLKYILTGSSAGAALHNVCSMTGTGVYHFYDSEALVEVDDVDDTVVFINEDAGSSAESYIKNTILNMTMTNVAYSGACGIFYLHGSAANKQIQHSYFRLKSDGNGTGYIFYMDTTGNNGVITSVSNDAKCEGFTLNYCGNVSAGDTLNASFVTIECADGFVGAGTANVVSSPSEGSLTITGTTTSDIIDATSQLTLPDDTADTTEGNIRYNTTDNRPEFYNGTGWVAMGIPKIYEVTETSVAEGNNSVTGLSNNYNIKYIEVTTTSTQWDMTIYQADDYATRPLKIVEDRDGDYMIQLDLPWEDDDATGEFHYNFTSASGAEAHDIIIYAEERV